MATASLHLHLYCIKSSHSSSIHLANYRKWRINCSDSSNPNRGFGPKSTKPDDNKKKSSSNKISPNLPNQAPGLNSRVSLGDIEFEQRLQAVKKSALEQKKAEEVKQYGVIDYDAPTETDSSTIGLGTKIGVGVAVVVFGLVFALGDFLPSGRVSPTEKAATDDNKISAEEKAILEKRLKQFEVTLGVSPEDTTALEGAAVTLAEMRDYKRAATLLEKLTEKKASDPDAFRLLGEVKYELKDYEGSAAAYRSAEKASKAIDFEILRGLTNTLLAANKPDEAVQVLLATRDRLNREKYGGNTDGIDSGTVDMRLDVDPVQGIILKENGSVGDAERMFIQARFFAPDKAKILVDRYSR